MNAILLTRGGFIERLSAGVYTMLPLGLRVLKNIERIIREEIEAIGGVELLMPTLQPKENWQQTGRWDSYDALYKLETASGQQMVLGPTHEEVIAPLVKKRVSSYKDLPLYLYQFQNKFRQEKRSKSGLLRGREFLMKDLYSFHATEQDLDQYYEQAKAAYNRIFARCGIGEQTYLTYASGGTFSKYSHEFQTKTEAGEDLIYLCSKCQVAVNKEIIEDLKQQCPQCAGTKLTEIEAVEVGNIFKLKTKFSQPFDLNYTDEQGKKQQVLMGCYGIGLQRLMGAIVEVCHDQKGISWPASVAPFSAQLIGIGENKKIARACASLEKQLTKKGIGVLYDDRVNKSAGEKFSDAELIGCPNRLVISAKTLATKSVELSQRAAARQPIKLITLNKVVAALNL